MMRDKGGFTLIETLVALVVGGILAAVAYSGFGGVQGRLAVRSARAAFLSSHAQARSYAVERGVQVRLFADPDTDEVAVELGCDGLGGVIEFLDYGNNFAVDLQTNDGDLSLCMTPKGIANPALGSLGDEATVSFVRGGSSTSVILLPLGQVVIP
jgi:prepilin-type N-terminal cleavage/methylation domain-containing protein